MVAKDGRSCLLGDATIRNMDIQRRPDRIVPDVAIQINVLHT